MPTRPGGCIALGHTANYFDNRSWQMPNVSSRKIVNVKCQRLRKGKCQMSGGVALRANTQMSNVSSPRIANVKCQPSINRQCQMSAVQKSQMANVEITGGVAQVKSPSQNRLAVHLSWWHYFLRGGTNPHTLQVTLRANAHKKAG